MNFNGMTIGEVLDIAIDIAKRDDREAARRWVRDYRDWYVMHYPDRTDAAAGVIAENLSYYASRMGRDVETMVRRTFGLDTPIAAGL